MATPVLPASGVAARWTGGVVAVLLVLLAAFALPVASAHAAGPPKPPPSKQQIAAAKAKAAKTAEKLAATTRQLKATQAELTAVSAKAELAVARWQAAQAKAAQAKTVLQGAQNAAAAALATLADYRQQLNAYAVTAYMDGGPVADLAALLSATNPADVLTRNATLQQIGREQGRVVSGFVAASTAAAQTRETAQQADAAAQLLLAGAERARVQAADAVRLAQSLLLRVEDAKAQLVTATGKAKKEVTTLVKERAAALAAAQAAAARAAAERLRALAPVNGFPEATPAQGELVLKWAQAQLGVPYSWGGGDANGPTLGFDEGNGITAGTYTIGFDCSGLTLFAWAHAGYTLGHWTGAQWVQGVSVAKDKLRPGDLLFFATDVNDPSTIHHVGIYAGNGKMIDAPETGAVVRYDPAFNPQFIGAVRP